MSNHDVIVNWKFIVAERERERDKELIAAKVTSIEAGAYLQKKVAPNKKKLQLFFLQRSKNEWISPFCDIFLILEIHNFLADAR